MKTSSDRPSASFSARLSAPRSRRDPRAIRRTASARAPARRRRSRPGKTPSRGLPRPGLASLKGKIKPQSSASDRVELTPAYLFSGGEVGRATYAALEAEKIHGVLSRLVFVASLPRNHSRRAHRTGVARDERAQIDACQDCGEGAQARG